MSETITVVGNVATAPEKKIIGNDVAVTTFRVGSTERRYDRENKTWVDGPTNWFTVSAFRALAENAFVSLRVGDRVILRGRLTLREWDNGVKRGLTPEIEVDAIGHDLRWGTSSYNRVTASSRAEESWAAAEEDGADADDLKDRAAADEPDGNEELALIESLDAEKAVGATA